MERRKRYILWLACLALLMSTPALANNGAAPNVLVLPTGPGSISGVGENVQANLNMGLMSYQIKILVPTGRGSATPDPSVTYSSSAGAGLMGIGWSFSAGASISRLTVRGLPEYKNTDDFFAGGELVKIPGSEVYRARMEGGFVRYQWKQPDKDQKGYWIAEYPDGSKGYFGANAKGEIDDNAQITGLQGTYQWELVTKVDRNGNRVEYSYSKVGSMPYLDRIRWVFSKDGNPLYEVRMTYEDRPDPISDGKPGFDLQTTKRLKEIQVTSAGKRFRSYHFTYQDDTGLSRLIHVVRKGRDESKAYPVSFKMKYSNATLAKGGSKMVDMKTPLGIDFRGGNADFIDINGDGLPDVVDSSNPKHIFHFNTMKVDDKLQISEHDFNTKQENPTETSAKLSNSSVQMLDADGNGFTDMVDAVNRQIYLNFGNGKWEAKSTKLQNFPMNGTSADPNMRFMDYNGDKKIDVISSDGTTTTYWVSDGKGGWQVINGKMPIGRGFDRDKLRLIDMNGDGLMDVVYITSDSLEYRKYLGYGNWSEWIKVNVPGMDKYALDKQAQFSDINGDGMADMVAIINNSIVFFANKNGREFAAGIALTGASAPSDSSTTVRIVDINGNGSRDIVWINSSGKVSYVELFDKRPNLMTEISNGIGQRINVEYGSSVNYFIRDASCNKNSDKACSGPWENKLPMSFQVVTKITTWASRSDKPTDQAQPTSAERPQIQSIFYHNGFYDGKEKKFRGFRHVETLFDGDESVKSRKDEIKFDVGDKDIYMHGRMLERTSSDGAQHIYNKVAMTYGDCPVELGGVDGKSLPFPIRFICTKATETTHIEGQSEDKWRLTRSETTYDGFGNVIMSANLGEKDKDGDEQVTKTTYITPDKPNDPNTPWLLRYASKVEQCTSKTGPCTLTEMYYDGDAFKGLPLGQVSKGNVSRVRQRVKGEKYVEPNRSQYDEFGNITASKTANGAMRTYEWDGVYNRFPVKENIELDGYSMSMKTDWDYARSKVIRSTDLNGNVTEYGYDSFGRLVAVARPGTDLNNPSITHTYNLQAPLSTIVTELRSEKDGPFDRKTIRCIDGLGRTISQLKQVKEGVFIATSHIEHNRLGTLLMSWSNYQSDGKCRFTAPTGTNHTKHTYDGLGRMLTKEFIDGTKTRIVYEPFKRISFDAEDNNDKSTHYNTPQTSLLDGLGRVIEEIQIPSKGQTIVKKFAHSNLTVSGQSVITKVTMADGSVKQQEYDELGRTIKIIDPDRSTITNEYDDNGNVIASVDARGIKSIFTYDRLDRVTSIMQEGKPETKITYTYDKPTTQLKEATNLKGALASITYPVGGAYYSYDERTNVILHRRVLLGHTFDFNIISNHDGQETQLTEPNGRKITFELDGAGRIKAIPNHIKEFNYASNGLAQSIAFANGINTRYEYDKRNRRSKIDVGNGKVLTLQYTYDSINNPLSIQQTHGDQSFTAKYTYDNAYRLLKAEQGLNDENIEFQQDKLHNIIQKSSSIGSKSIAHIGEYKYDDKRIHSTTKAGKYTLAYDQSGHMTQCNDMKMAWDHMGRMTSVTLKGKNTAKFWYAGTHQRAIKEENGEHVYYVGPYLDIREGAYVSHLKILGDRTISTWSVKGIEKFFDDMDKDSKITVADAWLYHASKEGINDLKRKERGIDIDMTRDMLNSSIQRMLLGDKEVRYYYHTDHLGNVRAVTDAEGNVVQRKHYYPYGAIQAQTGNPSLFSFGFQSREWDRSTQAWSFLKRSLDPRLGKWMSPDPKFEGITGSTDEFNSYGMVENNPIAFRDKNGTSKIGAAIAGAVTMIAGMASFGLAGKGIMEINEGKQNSATWGALLIGGGVASGLVATISLGVFYFQVKGIGVKKQNMGSVNENKKALDFGAPNINKKIAALGNVKPDPVKPNMSEASVSRKRSISSTIVIKINSNNTPGGPDIRRQSSVGSIRRPSLEVSQISLSMPMAQQLRGSIDQRTRGISSMEGQMGRPRGANGSIQAEGRKRTNSGGALPGKRTKGGGNSK